MRTDIPDAGRPAYYTVRETAWILGIAPSIISRAIRLGTLRAVRRHGLLVVAASALTGCSHSPPAMPGGRPDEPDTG